MSTFNLLKSLHIGSVVRITGSHICLPLIVVSALNLISPTACLSQRVPVNQSIAGVALLDIDNLNLKAFMDNVSSLIGELRAQQERFSKQLSDVTNMTIALETNIRGLKTLMCAIGHSE